MQRLSFPSIRLLLSKNRRNDFCTTKAISPARGRPKKAKPTPPPYEECSPEPGCSTIVYVDGFYLKDSIKGIGVCWKVDDPRNIGLRLHGTPTIPRAELQAVILALYQAIAAKEEAIIVRSTAENIDNLFAKGWLYDWSKNNWRKKGTTPANLPDLYELDVLMRMIKFRFELLSDSDQSEEWNIAHRCACEVTTSTQTNLAYKQSNHAELYEYVLEAMKAYPSISPLEKFKRTRNLMKY